MTADHLSYKRAATFSLLGLTLQAVLGLAILIFAVLSADHAAFSASLYILSGCIVWLVLAIVFDQHRRERLEALEAESIAAATARQSTVFEETAEDLRLAHKRLVWMHRFLVPGTSLALAALLIGLGLWRFFDGSKLVSIKTFHPPEDRFRPWEIALGLTLALAGFLFGRWVSGMAKQKVWLALRAGATAIVGAALMGLMMAVAQFVDMVGPDNFLRYLQVIFPVMMVALGAEIVLNFVLAAYQPRKPGEMPRPAFDSRILGFVAAPDKIAESIGEAINYQFGFEVTGSWFYQLLSRSIVALVLVGVGVVWLMTTFAVVGPDERALRIRNGDMVGEVGPGLYMKYPWPFEQMERYKATEARRLDLASPAPDEGKPILWTNEHVTDEGRFYLFCRPPSGGAREQAGEAEYRDLAMVAVEVPVYYSIENVDKFERKLGPPEEREDRLRAEGQRILMRQLLTVRLDDLLGAARGRVSDEVGRLVRARFEELDCGIKVLFVGVQGVHPPTTTASTFEQVVASQQQKQALITTAQQERITTLAKAAGSVDTAERFIEGNRELDQLKTSGAPKDAQIRKEEELVRILSEGQGAAADILRAAKKDRWAKHMDARGRAEAYKGQLAAYHASPSIYMAQKYYETLKSAVSAARVYIISDDISLTIRANNEDIDSSGNPLSAPPKPEGSD